MITTLLSLVAAQNLAAPAPMTVPVETPQANVLMVGAIPYKNFTDIAPIIQAKSALSVDLDSGLILYQKNAEQKLPMASLTKLMTAIIILEENSLSDVVTVSGEATKIEGSKIWLRKGEKITVENLIKATLISSANDAALALGIYNAGSEDKFVEKMNRKAKVLSLENTNFMNPVGLDEENHYSTAFDLSILARYAMTKKTIREIVIQKEGGIASADGKITHKLTTTNELLSSYLKVLGLKTGTTDNAGQCLISVVENEKGNILVNVLLNSPNRFQEAKVLAEWGFRAYKWL